MDFKCSSQDRFYFLPPGHRRELPCLHKKSRRESGGRIRDGQSPGLLTISPSADPAICNFPGSPVATGDPVSIP